LSTVIILPLIFTSTGEVESTGSELESLSMSTGDKYCRALVLGGQTGLA
jgi:hypothetical protein